MPREILTHIEVNDSLPDFLHPFHLDSQGKIPALISNGSLGKIPYARAIGCPIIFDKNITFATGLAEDRFHQTYGDSVLGPSELEGVPYPLILAREKLLAGKKILEQDGKLESFFTTDSAYRIKIPGHIDVSVHKPKKPEDIEILARLLYEASLIKDAQLSAVSGIARFDEMTGQIEYYTTEAILGNIQPFDMANLLNRLTHNGHFSMGTPTYETIDFLVQRPKKIVTEVIQYKRDEETTDQTSINGSYETIAAKQIEISSEDNLWIQLAGIGFIPL